MISATVTEITPELAKLWLSQNDRNRKVNPKAVSDYARQMAAGKWALNGEAIKRSVTNQLLDGQQRLMAVVEADVAIMSLVIEGLAPETQDTMDGGRKRSAADSFAMDGTANYTFVAAIGRRAWMWDQGNIRFATSGTPSINEVKETVEKYPHIHRSAEIAARSSMSYRPSRGAVTGTAHHLFIQIDPDLTAEFFAQFTSGAIGDKDHPILALRARLLNDYTARKSVPFHQGLAFFIRTWNALREGRELSRIVHTAEEPMIRPL